MRFMGLDVGKARIGVAVSDETGFIARGIATLQRTSGEKDFKALARLVEENEVSHVVVGESTQHGWKCREAGLAHASLCRAVARGDSC